MPTNRDTSLAFVRDRKLGVQCIDVESILSRFVDEMDRGLVRGEGSLEMIPTFVSATDHVPLDEPVIVIDAGGTNLRICTVTFRAGGETELDNFVKFSMPGIGGEVSKQTFFDTLAEHVAPLAQLTDKIGFCFSYPTEILPNRDGRLIRWTKEVQIPELVGQLVGKGLVDTLDAMGHPGKRVVILNDTVACLLAGTIEGERRHCSDYVGFILGTGTNTAYLERTAAIEKRSDLDPEGSMIVNLESGNFAIDGRGPVDLAFDATTANPGRQTFEKMISGAYLGPLCLMALKTAATDGLLSIAAVTAVENLEDLTTIDMDNFLAEPFDPDNPFAALPWSEADREVIFIVCTEIVRRAALLTAINITGTVIKSGHGTSPLHPVCVNVDGSTFHKTNNFPRWALGFLDDLLGSRGIHYVTVHVENAPVLGAAIAALSNA